MFYIIFIFAIVWFIKKLVFTEPVVLSYDKKTSGETKYKRPTKSYIDSRGYRRFNDSNKLVHRYLTEKRIGRRLYDFEVVHHKDRNKLNNNIDNLELMNRGNHNEIHKEYLIRIGVLERN